MKNPPFQLGSPIATLAVVAVVGGGFLKSCDHLSGSFESSLSYLKTAGMAVFYILIIILALFLVLSIGEFLMSVADQFKAPDKGWKEHIDAFDYRISRLAHKVDLFEIKTNALNEKFYAVENGFNKFKKEFHDDWQKAAGDILREAARDPKVVATLKESLFPKLKASDPNQKTEDSDADKKGSTIDQHL